jgi:hypothetical protein
MKTLLIAFTVALGATTVAPPVVAVAAPAGPRSVIDTVAALEEQGFKVIVNKVGDVPLDQCTVGGVRNGREVTELKRNNRDRTVESIKYTTVYVDAAC